MNKKEAFYFLCVGADQSVRPIVRANGTFGGVSVSKLVKDERMDDLDSRHRLWRGLRISRE